MITSQSNKKAKGRAALLASALLLAFGSTATVAGKPKSFEVDFDKCFAEFGPDGYLFTFAGPATGDVTGSLKASVVALTEEIEPGQTYIAADYVVTGTVPFVARVGGRVDETTKDAVLRGYVTEGPAWLVGAGVDDEFENYVRADGTPCSRGTLEITPRWK